MTDAPQFPGQQYPGQPNPQDPRQPYPGQQPPPYPGTQAAPLPKRKKPWFRRWWVWLLAIILIFAIGNALGKGGSTDSTPAANAPSASTKPAAPAKPADKPKEKLTLDDGWKVDKSNPYAVYVTGYVTNNTDEAISNYVQITFDTLDAKGANLGTCLANTNTIDANGKWKFKAICMDASKEVSKVRFKEITGF